MLFLSLLYYLLKFNIVKRYVCELEAKSKAALSYQKWNGILQLFKAMPNNQSYYRVFPWERFPSNSVNEGQYYTIN